MNVEDNYWIRNARLARLRRRQFLHRGGILAGGLGALAIVGCGDDDDDDSAPTQTQTTATAGAGSPEATQGNGNGGSDFDPNAKVEAGFTFVHDSMDPHDVTLPPYGIPFRAIFDGLTYRMPDSSIAAGLASSWETDDATSYVFNLNPEAKWHNGDPFTAEDVKFTAERVIADQKPSARILGPLTVEIIDDYTVKMTLDHADALFPQAIADTAMLPSQYINSVGGMDGFVAAPIGTGRFKLLEFSGGDLVRVGRVEDGWRELPNVAEVAMRVIPDNATRIAALQSGQIMIADSLPPESVEQFEGSSDIMIQAGLLPNVLTIDLLDPNCQDPRVRRAMNMAVDKQAIIDQLFAGKGAAVGQAVGPNAFGYIDDFEPIAFDQAEAKSLLSAAGLEDGFESTLTHSTAIAGEALAAEAVVGFLSQIGININLQTIEPSVRLHNFINGSPEPLFTWAGGYANLMDAAACLTYYKENNGLGQVRYKNPEFDRVYDSMRADSDTESRLGKIRELNEMLREDLPVLWELCPASFTGVSNRIFDLEERGDGHIEFANMKIRA